LFNQQRRASRSSSGKTFYSSPVNRQQQGFNQPQRSINQNQPPSTSKPLQVKSIKSLMNQ
jgi:hypothetical protein